jgi:hypothetical protein
MVWLKGRAVRVARGSRNLPEMSSVTIRSHGALHDECSFEAL